MSKRTERVGTVISQAVQTVLRGGLNDPRVRGMITVTRVEVTRDLREAKVWISVLPAEHTELTMHGIRSATKHIRHQVSELVDMKHTPELHFRLDEAPRRQGEVLGAIAKAREEFEQADDATPAREESEP